jgi:hypothetical protein
VVRDQPELPGPRLPLVLHRPHLLVLHRLLAQLPLQVLRVGPRALARHLPQAWPLHLRVHQQQALEAFPDSWLAASAKQWRTLPPQ